MEIPHPIPAFHLLENYLWLLHDKKEAWVVDPGDAAPVVQTLEAMQCKLSGILLTHHHWDHTNGARELQQKYAAPVYGPANSPFEYIDHPLEDDDELVVLGRSFHILHVPGHTLDHVAYYSEQTQQSEPWLFCGDVLFAAGCGRVFEGDAEMMWRSLSRLSALPGNTRVYCAHEYTVDNLYFATHVEPDNSTIKARLKTEKEKRARDIPTLPTSIATEHDTNPFLRVEHPELLKALGAADPLSQTDPVSVFAKLRAQKDEFRAPG